MFFASDNCGPALPEVMAALAEANTAYVAVLRRGCADGPGPHVDQRAF